MEVSGGDVAASLDDIAKKVEVAICSLHAPHGASVAKDQLTAAQELQERLQQQAGVHQVSIKLVDAQRPPQVQHFGFHILLSALRHRPPVLGEHERAQTRTWLISLLASDHWNDKASPGLMGAQPAAPSYVRAKCAEVIAEVARADWPASWPELKPALLSAAAAAAGQAALALSVWCHIAELLIEDAKDLTPPRQKELRTSLTALVREPTQSPELVSSIQQALRQHGSSRHVVQTALGLCRALANAVPVAALLQNNLDSIVRIGLEIAELREMSVSVLAEWVDKVFPGKGKVQDLATVGIATHDLCRFTAMIVQLAKRCLYDGSQQTYAFHRQVAELVSDFCSSNADNLTYHLPASDLEALWSSLLHLLRFPSLLVQLDAAAGMCALAKAAPNEWNRSSQSPPRPALEKLVNTLFVLVVKLESLPLGDLAPDRSDWLLRCLGPPSCASPIKDFQTWCQLVDQTHASDLRDGTKAASERGQIFGQLKAKALELITCAVKPESDAQAPEGFGALCRYTSGLMVRALTAAGTGKTSWFAEFESATALVERPGSQILKRSAPSENALKLVLPASLDLLRVVTMPTEVFSEQLEDRRLEFLAHWAPFYRHFGDEIVGQVLQRLMAGIEMSPTDAGVHKTLQTRALNSLISLGKHGAISPGHLDALNGECQRLAPKLNPVARAKLVEAMAVAVVMRKELAPERKISLISGLMAQATSAWRSCDLAQRPDAGQLLALLSAAASSSQAPGAPSSDESLTKIREARTLVQLFWGVVSRACSTDGSAGEGGTQGAADAKAEGGEKDADMDGSGAGSSKKEGKGGGKGRKGKKKGQKGKSTGEGAEKEKDGNQDKAKPAEACAQVHLAAEVVKAWAPGIIALAQSLGQLRTLVAGSSDPIACFLFNRPAEYELDAMLSASERSGRPKQDVTENIPPGIEAARVNLVRGLFWEMQSSVMVAVRACTLCPDFWSLPEACTWVCSLAEMLPSQPPHVADLILREVFIPLLRGVGGQGAEGMASVPTERRQVVLRAVVPGLVASMRQAVKSLWDPSSKAAEAASSYELAFATSVVSVTRSSSKLLASLAGGGQGTATFLANPARRLFVRGLNKSAVLPSDGGGGGRQSNKRKQRDRNSFAALADEEEDEEPAAKVARAMPEPEPIAGSASLVVQERELHEAVRAGLVELLAVPEANVTKEALAGLTAWTAQLWNVIARGEDPTALEVGAVKGRLPEAGEMIHAASNSLRVLPRGILEPTTRLIAAPPSASSTGEAPGRICAPAVAPGSALASLVEQSWSAYIAPTRVHDVQAPSKLVSDTTAVVSTAVFVLTKLMKIQCRKLDLTPGLDKLHLCPTLHEAMQVCREMPNTSEHDVHVVLAEMFKREVMSDLDRGAVRVMLYEASPTFSDGQADR